MEKINSMRFRIILPLLFGVLISNAQIYIPLGNDVYHFVDRLEIKSGKQGAINFHSSSKGYTYESVLRLIDSSWYTSWADHSDAEAFYSQAFFYVPHRETKRPVFKYFYKQKSALYSINTDAFKLSINPVLYFGGAIETGKADGNEFIKQLYITLSYFCVRKVFSQCCTVNRN